MTGEVRADALSEPMSRPPTGEIPIAAPPRREPGRITIGTDPSGVERRPPPGRSRRGASSPTRAGRPGRPGPHVGRAHPAAAQPAGRHRRRPRPRRRVRRRHAVAAGRRRRPRHDRARHRRLRVLRQGHREGLPPGGGARPGGVRRRAARRLLGRGAAASRSSSRSPSSPAPSASSGRPGVESGPLPNMAVTTMGVVWIGLLGSFAALILRWSTAFGADNNIGTDTLFLIVLGVVANDIGALALGSSIGKTPLRPWISPGKTLEGLIGGTLLTFLVLFIVGLTDRSDTWSTGDLLILALVISVFAPLGDLTESMFKRNLDVKDFGALVTRPRWRARPLRRLPVRAAGGVLRHAVCSSPGTDGAPVRVAIAGSSGSIGTQTLDVVRAEAPRYEVVGLGVGSSVETLIAQAKEFRPALVAVGDPARRAEVAAALPGRDRRRRPRRPRRATPTSSSTPSSASPACRSRMATLRQGKRLALANKESLIAAGPGRAAAAGDAGRRARARRQRALRRPPVPARRRRAPEREVARLLITASGGPFRGRTARRARRRAGRARRWPIRRGRWVRRSPSTPAR